MRWLQFKEIVVLKCCLLLFYTTTTNHFLIGLWHIRQSAMVKFVPKNGSWSLVVGCWSDPLQHSESRQNHYIWEESSKINETHWKLQCLQPTLVNRKGPILHDSTCPHSIQPTLQKLNKLGYKVLSHLPYSPNFASTEYHFFKRVDNFCRENAFKTSRTWKMLSKISLNLEVCYRNKQTYFLLAKCVDCKDSYFD